MLSNLNITAYSFGFGDPLLFNNFASSTSSWDFDKTEDKKKTQTDKVDFGPYMRSLQRSLRKNWIMPETSKDDIRVVLRFRINKDGSHENCEIYKSSGNKEFDESALRAFKLSAPFKPLPEDYDGEFINVQFTLSPLVFGVCRY